MDTAPTSPAARALLSQVPSELLEWNFRLPLILEEIKESQAELVCLQECNHFGEDTLRMPSLQRHGR